MLCRAAKTCAKDARELIKVQYELPEALKPKTLSVSEHVRGTAAAVGKLECFSQLENIQVLWAIIMAIRGVDTEVLSREFFIKIGKMILPIIKLRAHIQRYNDWQDPAYAINLCKTYFRLNRDNNDGKAYLHSKTSDDQVIEWNDLVKNNCERLFTECDFIAEEMEKKGEDFKLEDWDSLDEESEGEQIVEIKPQEPSDSQTVTENSNGTVNRTV